MAGVLPLCREPRTARPPPDVAETARGAGAISDCLDCGLRGRPMNRSGRMMVVSNRLPITVEPCQSGFRVRPSCGGLVSALRPLLRNQNASWIGWTGTDVDPKIVELLRQYSTR